MIVLIGCLIAEGTGSWSCPLTLPKAVIGKEDTPVERPSAATTAMPRDAAGPVAQQRRSVLQRAGEVGNGAEVHRQQGPDRTRFQAWKRCCRGPGRAAGRRWCCRPVRPQAGLLPDGLTAGLQNPLGVVRRDPVVRKAEPVHPGRWR